METGRTDWQCSRTTCHSFCFALLLDLALLVLFVYLRLPQTQSFSFSSLVLGLQTFTTTPTSTAHPFIEMVRLVMPNITKKFDLEIIALFQFKVSEQSSYQKLILNNFIFQTLLDYRELSFAFLIAVLGMLILFICVFVVP